MLKQKLIRFFLTVFPVLILLGFSLYFALDSWSSYQTLYHKHVIIDAHTQELLTTHLWTLGLYILLFLLSLFSLLYMYKQHQEEKKAHKALLAAVKKIHALSTYASSDSQSLYEMLAAADTPKDIFNYLSHSFQLLQSKCKQSNDDAASKTQFLSTLSHEIRTPLNGIIGFSKLLRDMGTTVDQEEFLTLIEGSSRTLISIVNDVLDLSKMNAEKMQIEQIPFNLFETVESTVASFTQQTDQKDIELGIYIDPTLAHYFVGDATKLSQVLTNLIANAVKFTEPYGKINILLEKVKETGTVSEIRFSIQDNGIGLSHEHIKNIFNAFSQATQSTSSKYGGTGLGLTISSKIIELMGGRIEVQSVLDEGTQFFFTLKLEKDSESTFEPYPNFSNKKVGLALPVRHIDRQLEKNIENYLRHLGAEVSYYYYDDIFNKKSKIDLPDIMIFDHRYARLEGELAQCSSLDCLCVLLTNGGLSIHINPREHHFSDIIYAPITLRKTVRILNNIVVKKQEVLSKDASDQEEAVTGIHALIADDNLINRKLINIILQKVGLKVTLTSNGQEVFDAYKKGSYDIIFMDIQMPIMDGVQATHKILEYEREEKLPHVPIVALTANVAEGNKERFMGEGMDDYATKPLEIETLKSIISRHCGIDLTSENKDK
ncbi:MAG: response regulator [Sulfurovum sp.]|nr:response regulator [Sulfurovum sp.]